MSNGRRHKRVLVLSLGLIALIAGMLPQVIEAGGPKEHDPNVTPTSVDAGKAIAFDVSIKNTSTSGNITAQALRIYLDSDLPASSVTSVAKKPANAAGTITPIATTLVGSTPYIEVLNVNVRRNDTYTVTVNVNMPCVAANTAFDWTTDVRQSNDFNGTNNQIPAVSPDPTPATSTVANACSLAFSAQPKSALPDTTITNTAFDPNASTKVQVAVKSGGATPTTVTWATGNVTVATAPATTLAGTKTQALVSGVATFSDLSIHAPANYQLTASLGTLNATSAIFTIGNGVTTTCTAGDSNPCQTGNIPGPTGGTTGNVVVNDNDGITGNLTAQFITNDIDCQGYTEFGDRLFFDVEVTQGSLAGKTKTVTVTKPIPSGMPAGAGEEWRYQVCFQSRDQFQAITYSNDAQENFDTLLKALSGGDVTSDAELVPVAERVLGDKSAPEYRGLLPQCSLVNNVAPCIDGQPTFNAAKTLVTWVGKVPAADPVWK